MNRKTAKLLSGCFLLFTFSNANPVFTPGVWLNISPQTIDLSSAHYGSPEVDLDLSNPSTLYLCVDMQGLWKTTDGGSSWSRLGTPGDADTDTTTSYLDSPVRITVDPENSLHLYATQGVRGNTQGFWVSTDGGLHWKQPSGFITAKKIIGTQDMTSFDVDPSDFNIVLSARIQAGKV